MEKRDFEMIIDQQGVIEIDYENKQGKRSLLHISFVEKMKNGNFMAFCKESNKDLVFKEEGVYCTKWIWKNIYCKEDTAPEDGIYIFACRGDNHLIFECYQMKKGDLLWKYFEGKYHHSDGCFDVDPVSFHKVDFYSESSSDWENYIDYVNCEISPPKKDWQKEYIFELFAIKIDERIEYTMNDYFSIFSNPSLNPYYGNVLGDSHTDVVAVHRFVSFDERDHFTYWNTFSAIEKKRKKNENLEPSSRQ